MSDDNTQTELSAENTQPSELDLLKQRAKMLGVEFSNNIGLETLKERVAAKLAGESNQESQAQANPLAGESSEEEAEKGEAPVKRKSLRQHLVDEQTKLIRIRIQNLDPKKKDLQGEIVTVANEHLGTIKKFVPYGEASEEGYHVPYCIYKYLIAKKFLQIKTRKNKVNGQIVVTSDWVREFSIEVLPDLTKKELQHLAATQAAAGNIG